MTVNGWVDVHAHYTPPISEQERHARWEAYRALSFMAPHPHLWTPETTLDYMDRTGIAVQLLSNVPQNHDALRESNDYGAQLVIEHPTRFGLLAALPTDDPEVAVAEIVRATADLNPDGWALSTTYNHINLSNPALEPVWSQLDHRHATVFIHPDTTGPPQLGLPTPLIEVAFDTTRTVVAMMYAGVFTRHPHIRFILAHCGGALPALSGRLQLLGTQPWVGPSAGITRDEIRRQLSRLYLDTAASGTDANLAAALTMVPADHIVYGADCGVPCSTDDTMGANITALQNSALLDGDQVTALGRRALTLFPNAANRAATPAAVR